MELDIFETASIRFKFFFLCLTNTVFTTCLEGDGIREHVYLLSENINNAKKKIIYMYIKCTSVD